ncbi:tetratricopeptide repeat protein [Phocaeicola coprophilus]|nr:tetratricopeptide repeat protein [Phocaeicola coprophilus]
MKRLNLFLLGACVAASSLYAQSDDWKAGVEKVKDLIKTNPEMAEEQADDLLKGKNKKNVDLVLAIGRAYMEAGQLEQAEDYVKIAKKADSKSAAVSIFEGDIAVARKDPGTASQRYEEAIYFDPNCKEAYLKYADIYKAANPGLATSKLEELRAIDPQAVEVDRKLAEIYYSANEFDKAADAYSRFAEGDKATEKDLVNYSFALFLNHDFEKSLAVANLGLQKNPQHAVFNRLRMYNFIDLKRYDEAKQAADSFFAACKTEDLTYLDYLYHGTLLDALKDYNNAVISLEKAYEMNKDRTEVLRQISSSYEGAEKYEEAIDAFNKYVATLPEEQKTPDLTFEVGRLYYAEGTTADSVNYTPEMKKEALLQADSAFAKLAELVPDNYLGNFWRARTNSALDPETTEGLAKPYYEQVAAMLEEKAKTEPRYNRTIIECYRYLGYYYLVTEDYEKSKEYWNKILTIDPEDAIATKALEGIK